MISFSEPRAVVERRRLVELGHSIHRAVVEEGRREGVLAYLYHWQDERGEWRARFEKYDRRTGLVSCRFSSGLATRIRVNAEAVRAYARWLEGQVEEAACPAVALRPGLTALEIARARVARQAAVGAAPGVGSDAPETKPHPNRRGERTELTNEKRERIKR